MKRTISVTAEDITRGERYASCFCPIALAMNRELGKEVHVLTHTAWWPKPNRATEIENSVSLPAEAREFIDAFDSRDFDEPYPEPFTFEIDLPDASQVSQELAERDCMTVAHERAEQDE